MAGFSDQVAAADAARRRQLAQNITGVMGEVSIGLKEELRDQVRRAGLGNRLANTWRGTVYPRGASSIEAAAYVWTKAPKLIDAYWRGASIYPTGGRFYLA